MDKLTVACVRVGDKYGDDYTTNLRAMVERHLQRPAVFKCITDQRVVPGWECLHADPAFPVWWQKVSLWRPAFFSGRVLYLDLDVVIVGSLDEIAEHKGIFWDWHQTHSYGSAVMCWDAGEHSEVWRWAHELEMNSDGITARWRNENYYGDQDYITATAKMADSLWPIFPPEWCVSYRTHCGYGSETGPPPGAKVVCCHGTPKPAEIVLNSPHGWVAKMWR
jgi:hypothetical protein